VFLQDFALGLFEVSAVLLGFWIPESSTKEATESTEIGSEMEAEGAIRDASASLRFNVSCSKFSAEGHSTTDCPDKGQIVSTVFSSFFALELLKFSTVLFGFGALEFFTVEATESTETGSEVKAEGTTTDFTDLTDGDF
jgi:hypothetical protein